MITSRVTAQWREWAAALFIGSAAVCIPFLANLTTGAIDIPRNDDWAYIRIIFRLIENRELRLVGWNDMNLIGHLVWPLPLLLVTGPSLRALHVAQAIISVIGLLSVYAVARHFLSKADALLVLVIVAAFPAFFVHTSSFMTDPPALAAQTLCLALGLTSLTRHGRGALLYFYAALIIGFWAFTIREFAVASLLAVIVGRSLTPVRPGRKYQIAAITGACFTLMACLVFYIWRQQLPYSSSVTPEGLQLGRRLWMLWDGMRAGFFTTAFGLLPASIIALARFKGARRIPLITGGLLAVLTVAWLRKGVAANAGLVLAPNTITPAGYLGDVVSVGARPLIVPPWLWAAFVLLVAFAGVLLAAAISSRVHLLKEKAANQKRVGASPHAILVAYCLIQLVLIAAVIFIRAQVPFDRYLLVLLPPLAIMLLLPLPNTVAGLSSYVKVGAGAALLLVISVSGILALNAAAFDAARWQAGVAAAAQGYEPDVIDAGFEWVGYHYPGVAQNDPIGPRWNEPIPWYAGAYGRSGNCIIVAASPLPHQRLEPLEVRTYRMFTFWGNGSLWLYKNPQSCLAVRAEGD